jgi:hypothetical protein
MGGQRHAPAALHPGKSPGIHSAGGRVGPTAGLDRCGKDRFLAAMGVNRRTVQPVASRLGLSAVLYCPEMVLPLRPRPC